MGLGQIYNGQIGKGVLFIIFYGISVALMWVVIGVRYNANSLDLGYDRCEQVRKTSERTLGKGHDGHLNVRQ